MYVILWEFRVRQGREKEFEEAYGPAGTWGRFFARGEGYRGTDLHRDLAGGRRYVTIDRWTSQAAYETFRDRHREEYEAIDARCEALTEHESPLGSFASVGEVGGAMRGRGGGVAQARSHEHGERREHGMGHGRRES